MLPGGSIGRQYVETLAEEIHHLAVGNHPSDHVLVFSSVILQCDKMVKKGADIRRLLGRRLQSWQQGHYDLLIQEQPVVISHFVVLIDFLLIRIPSSVYSPS